MRKIVFLLITSLVLVSCGRDNEPYYPESGNSGSTYFPNNNNSNGQSGKPFGDVNPPAMGQIYYKNMSNIITYKCYLLNKVQTVLAPNSTSQYYKCTDGKYTIKVEQSDNIYNDDVATYIDDVVIQSGKTICIDFPLLSTLTLHNVSNVDYYITINDGLAEYVCNGGDAIILKNIDCTTFKVKFTQKNGYLFFPTKKTVYINVPKEGKIYKFNP